MSLHYSAVLMNPKYCGEGRNLRWFTAWDKKKNEHTGRVREVKTVEDRMRDEVAWRAETCPTAPGAIPPLVTPEQWHRVQAKLKAAAALKGRGGPRRTDPAAHSTLLDGGLVRCAECDRAMTRYWHSRTARPFYTCTKRNNQPSHPHLAHQIPAYKVDALALRLLAQTLTDPDRILQLADAAEAQLAAAETDAALAEANLAAYRKRLAEIEAEQDKLLAGLDALSKARGMEHVVADIRAQLARLDDERREAEAERAGDIPRRDRAAERAAFLRRLFTTRDVSLEYHGPGRPPSAAAIGEPYLGIGSYVEFAGKDGEPITYSRLTPAEAAALLGVPEDEIDLPILRGVQAIYGYDDGAEVVIDLPDFVDANDVIELLLKRTPRDRLRRLLRDLDAVVKVGRPWSRAEVAARGWTPVEARVSLHLLGAVAVRIDAAKLSPSSAQAAELAAPACSKTSGSPSPVTS